MQPKKLFIDLDGYDEDRMQTLARSFGIESGKWDFDKIIQNTHAAEAFLDVCDADEIYADTALINSMLNMGSANMFNYLCASAASNNIEGKKIFLFRTYNAVHWGNLKTKYVDPAFKKNYLYVIKENEDTWSEWEQVDIDKLIREELS